MSAAALNRVISAHAAVIISNGSTGLYNDPSQLQPGTQRSRSLQFMITLIKMSQQNCLVHLPLNDFKMWRFLAQQFHEC